MGWHFVYCVMMVRCKYAWQVKQFHANSQTAQICTCAQCTCAQWPRCAWYWGVPNYLCIWPACSMLYGTNHYGKMLCSMFYTNLLTLLYNEFELLFSLKDLKPTCFIFYINIAFAFSACYKKHINFRWHASWYGSYFFLLAWQLKCCHLKDAIVLTAKPCSFLSPSFSVCISKSGHQIVA